MLQSIESLEAVRHLAVLSFSLVILALLVYFIAGAFYNVFLHPLRSYPGPLLNRMSWLPWDYHMYTGSLTQYTDQLHQRYGPSIRIAPGELSFIQAQAFKDILSHTPGKEELPKDQLNQAQNPNGISNILGANRENHARYRRLLAHAFSEKGLREQESHIIKYVDLLIDRLRERAVVGQTTDLVEWIDRIVFDVIGDLAFGESFNCLEERRTHEWIPAVAGSLKFVAISNIFRRHGLDFAIPYLVSKQSQELRARNLRLSQEKVDNRNKEGVRGDFWDRVLIKSANDNVKGEGMTRGEMIVNASVLVLGGAETSATALSGSTFLLLKHPAALEKLVHEVRSAFKSSDEITLFSVSQLPYNFAVLEETMRLYPPVARQSARVVPRGGTVICGNLIPEGTAVAADQYSANRSGDNFHRPNDFVPERWLDDAPAEFQNDDKAAFQPFSLGTRNCIGRNLAYAEMRLILAKLHWHFDLTLDESTKGDWFDQKAWVAWFRHPLYVHLTEAQK